MQIIDPHHHLWNVDEYRRPYTGAAAVREDAVSGRKNYGWSDYLADTRNFDVLATVHVEAGLDHWNPVRETKFLADVSRRSGCPIAIVAYVPMETAAAPEIIRAHLAASPSVRGIRQSVAWHSGDRFRHSSQRHFLRDERWLQNFSFLKDHNLSFDLEGFPGQMRDIDALARMHPATQIIINHAGLPGGLGQHDLAEWKRAMRLVSKRANVQVKISGFGMICPDWTAGNIRPVVRTLIDLFGPDRAMFASNFPVEKATKTFDRTYSAYLEAVSDLSPEEQRLLFSGTAARIYQPTPSVKLPTAELIS